MFCKYKTNIAKRKKQSANTLFLSRSHPSTLSISSILPYLLYLIYIIYLLYHIYLLYPVYPSSRTAGGGIRLSELKLILYANNMSVRLVIVIVVMYRLIEIVQPHFMFLSNLPVYACRIACLLH